jgi:hypothetical protein
MTRYIVDDGEDVYTVDLKIPPVKRKILRKHKKVMSAIKKVWLDIRIMLQMLVNHGIDTDDIMKKYVRLFLMNARSLNQHKQVTIY